MTEENKVETKYDLVETDHTSISPWPWTEEEINAIESRPEENPCEKSEQLCQLVSEAKEKAIQKIKRTCFKEINDLFYSQDEYKILQEKTMAFGFKTVNDYIHFITLHAIITPTVSQAVVEENIKNYI
jgi:hypothetical protein